MKKLLTLTLTGCMLAAHQGCAADPGTTRATGSATVTDAGNLAQDAGMMPPTTTPPVDMMPAPAVDAGPCQDAVDIVLALDVSSSMGFVLEDLEQDIAKVVMRANKLAPDAHFGLLPFVDNHAFDKSGPLEGGIVHTSGTTMQSAFSKIRDTYTTPNRNPGDGPSGLTSQNPICEENAIDALYAAAMDFPWRANATRIAIIATDDSFLEGGDNYGDRDGDKRTDKTNYPREGDYPARHTIAETVKALQDKKVRVFSFARKGHPGNILQMCGCGTGCRLGESTHTGDGWWVPYGSQAPIPDQTDGRNFDLEAVQSGGLSLADTINDVVVESYCVPPIL